jgi:hypothetical protein
MLETKVKTKNGGEDMSMAFNPLTIICLCPHEDCDFCVIQTSIGSFISTEPYDPLKARLQKAIKSLVHVD